VGTNTVIYAIGDIFSGFFWPVAGTTNIGYAAALGDINGDGYLDGVTGAAPELLEGVEVLMTNSLGLPAYTTPLTAPSGQGGAARLFLIDMDGDYLPDLVVFPGGGLPWRVYLNSGTAPYFQSGE
jgi:hypothetical protein